MTPSTRSRVTSFTFGSPFATRDTVCRESPETRATSRIDGRRVSMSDPRESESEAKRARPGQAVLRKCTRTPGVVAAHTAPHERGAQHRALDGGQLVWMRGRLDLVGRPRQRREL